MNLKKKIENTNPQLVFSTCSCLICSLLSNRSNSLRKRCTWRIDSKGGASRWWFSRWAPGVTIVYKLGVSWVEITPVKPDEKWPCIIFIGVIIPFQEWVYQKWLLTINHLLGTQLIDVITWRCDAWVCALKLNTCRHVVADVFCRKSCYSNSEWKCCLWKNTWIIMMEICFYSSALGANLDGGEIPKESMNRHEAKHDMRPAHQIGPGDQKFELRGPWSVERVCFQFEDGEHVKHLYPSKKWIPIPRTFWYVNNSRYITFYYILLLINTCTLHSFVRCLWCG